MAERTYLVNEVFYSLQGEGMRAGEASVFLRLARCNLRCTVEPGPKSPGGFDCDTEFESGVRMTAEEIHDACARAASDTPGDHVGRWIVLTGGEPALQADLALCRELRAEGWRLAIETNGSLMLTPDASCLEPGCDSTVGELAHDRCPHHGPPRTMGLDDLLTWRFPQFDWICVSPKVAEHAIRQRWAHEVRYVRGLGQGVPQTRVDALHQLLSPATDGLHIDPRTVRHCVELCKTYPSWRLSVQLHKDWGVR